MALPGSAEAVAHGRPPATNARAAAAEEQVIVQLVLLYRRPSADDWYGRALDRERDGTVVRRRKDVPAEAVVVRLPPNWHALRPATQRKEGGGRDVSDSCTRAAGGGHAPRSTRPSGCTTHWRPARNMRRSSSLRATRASRDASRPALVPRPLPSPAPRSARAWTCVAHARSPQMTVAAVCAREKY